MTSQDIFILYSSLIPDLQNIASQYIQYDKWIIVRYPGMKWNMIKNELYFDFEIGDLERAQSYYSSFVPHSLDEQATVDELYEVSRNYHGFYTIWRYLDETVEEKEVTTEVLDKIKNVYSQLPRTAFSNFDTVTFNPKASSIDELYKLIPRVFAMYCTVCPYCHPSYYKDKDNLFSQFETLERLKNKDNKDLLVFGYRFDYKSYDNFNDDSMSLVILECRHVMIFGSPNVPNDMPKEVYYYNYECYWKYAECGEMSKLIE